MKVRKHSQVCQNFVLEMKKHWEYGSEKEKRVVVRVERWERATLTSLWDNAPYLVLLSNDISKETKNKMMVINVRLNVHFCERFNRSPSLFLFIYISNQSLRMKGCQITLFCSSGRFFHASPERFANSSLDKSFPILSRISFEKNKKAEIAFFGPL